MIQPLPDLLIEPTVRAALAEDLGRAGDITAQACIDADAVMSVVFATRQSGVVAGLACARLAILALDPKASFGAVVEDGARVEAGAVITRQVPARAVVQGPQATIVGYVDAAARAPLRLVPTTPGTVESVVKGVRLHVLREVRDMRGDLCAAQVGDGLPFVVQRSFLVYNVPNAELRGEHAHRRCGQFLMAVKGSVRVVVDDGSQREEFILDRPNLGLHLPPMTWGIQYRYSEDAVLLVLASDPYDPADYIRDYDEFVALARRGVA